MRLPRLHMFRVGNEVHNHFQSNMAVSAEDGILLRSTNRDLLSAIFKDTIPGIVKMFLLC
jgi:hypothetical protein